MSYVLGISDNLPTSPLTFIRPDVLVHIHDLWVKQKHDQITHRSFTAVFDLSALRPFVVVGLDHVMNYVRNWRFSDSDIEFLQSLPSCSTFQAPFWLYLRNIQKFPGNIRGVREGEIYGTSPMQMSDELRTNFQVIGLEN